MYRNINFAFLLAFATRSCTNETRWEEKGDYNLCIGCTLDEVSNSVCILNEFCSWIERCLFQTASPAFSLPISYIVTRRYFIVGANGLSIILLAFGILILLGNRFVCFENKDFPWTIFFCSRLRQCSRNVLHVNVFLVFLIRSAIQLFAELRMSNGYFEHNVFNRTDACNRTTLYFKDTVREQSPSTNLLHSLIFSLLIVNYSLYL